MAAVRRRDLDQPGEQRAAHHHAIDDNRVRQPHVRDVAAPSAGDAATSFASRSGDVRAIGHDLPGAPRSRARRAPLFPVEVAIRMRRRQHFREQGFRDAPVPENTGDLLDEVGEADHTRADVRGDGPGAVARMTAEGS